MSFKDVGRNTSIQAMPKTIRVNIEAESDPKILEQISPKLVFDQISDALRHHQQDRNVLKEKSLINHATTVPRYSSEKNLSAFSKLSDEIVKFQKLTNDLQAIVNQDMTTPEDQWKIRILLQSAKDADSDLASAIQQSPWNQKDLTVKASFSKLKRDFERAHNAYEDAVRTYLTRQKAEAALLSSPIDHKAIRNRIRERRKRSVEKVESKEDFFDRVMREREKEAEEINKSLHVVQNIYRELDRLVSSQQENIDLVSGQVRYARANVEVGLEHLEDANDGHYGFAKYIGAEPRRQNATEYISLEDFNWKLPFQTFQQDIFEVRNDLMDLFNVSATKIKNIGSSDLLRCGSHTSNNSQRFEGSERMRHSTFSCL